MTYRSAAAIGLGVLLFVSLVTQAADDGFATEEQKVFYYLGTVFGTQLNENLTPLSLSAEELAVVERGMHDALVDQTVALDDAIYGQKLNEMAQQRMLAQAEGEATAASAYIGQMSAEDGAITTDSGLVIKELNAGEGASPTPDSTVTAHYHGTLRDGTVFDSSVERGQPFTSSLSSVIPCWREAIPLMKEGGKSKITCPSDLAYGSRGSGAIPGGAALTFEVELIEVVN